MNRSQRRKRDIEDLSRADVNLRNLRPTAFAPTRRGTRSFSVVAKTDFEMWAQIVVETLRQMGITEGQWITGFLLDFLNSQAPDVRKMIAVGILQGLGMTVLQKAGEKEGELILEVQFDPKYEPLLPREKKPGKLWTPGDDLPGPGVLQ